MQVFCALCVEDLHVYQVKKGNSMSIKTVGFAVSVGLLTQCGGPEKVVIEKTIIEEIAAVDAASDVDSDAEGRTTMGKGFQNTTELQMFNSTPKNAMNVNFGTGDEEDASEYTVSFGITPADSGVLSVDPNVRATVRWNINGVSIQRIVTLGQGMALSGSATGVSVDLQDFSTAEIRANTASEYIVTTMISPGTRPANSYPPTLIPITAEESGTGTIDSFGGTYSLLGGQSVEVSVPINAGVRSYYISLGVSSSSNENATVEVVELDLAGTPLRSYYLTGSTNGFVAISNRTSKIYLGNIDALVTIEYASLTWGIEG
jgi:hypothetical protein